MPEGDSIFRAARTLDRALAGRTVTRFESVFPRLTRIDRRDPVRGRTLERVTPRGKHLLMWFSGELVLHTHMRMNGSWHLYRPGERWRRARHAMRLRLDTDAWIAVAFDVHDAECVAAADATTVPAIARLGPDLLAAEVDVAGIARRIVAEGDRALADVLLDQRVMAGVGNVFRSELLFVQGLHPRTAAGALDTAAAHALVRRAVRLLRVNARPGASRRNTTGRTAPGESLWVYQRTGQPCRRCGAPVQSAADAPLARRVYWCPTCQPAPAAAERSPA
jgi:endonuclease-8